jgi:dTDP-4-dehydrorhamnose 3,5-epimerase
MNIIKTDIDGVVIIEPKIFEDSRGYFFESFNELELGKKIGLVNFV